MTNNDNIKNTLLKGSQFESTFFRESTGIEETIAKSLTYGYGKIDQKILADAEAGVKEDWELGDLILNFYEVTDVLGEGAFGKVYKVYHKGWNEYLAVKSLKVELCRDKAHRKNFIFECEGWVNLGLHPHIVNCYYVRDLGGLPRIFSEFIEGGSLENWLEVGKVWEWKEIIDLAIQFFDGLSYAHKKGLIHRDIKPANCLMTSTGEIKITDFGVASGLATLGVDITESKKSGVTRTMMFKEGVVGTPAYMPPEQWDKYGILGPSSDIYAFGVMLFEICCEERPFDEDGEDIFVLKIRHTSVEPTNPQEINSDIPRSLSDFILKCLKKKPSERFRNCDEARAELVNIYREVVGESYARENPGEAELLSDSINNLAVSLIDLGKANEAENILNDALKKEKSHPYLTCNRNLLLWRSGRITDIEMIRQLKEVKKNHPDDIIVNYFLGLVHMERRDGEAAVSEFEEVRAKSIQLYELDELLQKSRKIKNGMSVRIFKGHTYSVSSISISPDGLYALSGSCDHTLRLWDIVTGKCIRIFEGHTDFVLSVRISPDGLYAISGSHDKTLRLWDIKTGKCLRIFEGHTDKVEAVSISPDDLYAISGSRDKTLRLWDIKTGKCLRIFEGYTNSVLSISISPDGLYVLPGSYDYILRLWEIKTGKCIKTFEGYKGYAKSVSISPDGLYAVSAGSWDKTFRLWDIKTGECIRIFKGHTANVESVSISSDGLYVISGGDKTLRLWDINTGKCIRTFEGHSHLVKAVSISPNGLYALSGSSDNTLRLWELGSGQDMSFIVAKPQSYIEIKKNAENFKTFMDNAEKYFKINSIKEAADFIKSGMELPGYKESEKALNLWGQAGKNGIRCGISSGWFIKDFKGHTNKVTSVSISPDGLYFISGSWDKTLRLWDIKMGKCLRIFKGHTDCVTSVSISPDGLYAISGSSDKTLRLWDTKTRKCIRIFEGHTSFVHSVSISPDGLYAISGSHDNTIRQWEIESGKCLKRFEGNASSVNSISISPDGLYAISGSWDKILRLWEIRTGKCIRIFEGHTNNVSSISISSDGLYAISGSWDKTLRLWEIKTGKCIEIFEGHTDNVTSVSISPDGLYAISAGGYDNTIQLWEIKTGKCIRTFEGHINNVSSISISPDSLYAISGSYDKILKLWEFKWNYEFPEEKDWDERAKPYLKNFLTIHTPYAGKVPKDREPTEEEIRLSLTREGKSIWTEEDFQKLLQTLSYAGYGWLRTEGVRRKLDNMAFV